MGQDMPVWSLDRLMYLIFEIISDIKDVLSAKAFYALAL